MQTSSYTFSHPFYSLRDKSYSIKQWSRMFKLHKITTVQFLSRLITVSEIFMKSGKKLNRSFDYSVPPSGPCKELRMIYIFIIFFLYNQLFSDKNLPLWNQESCQFDRSNINRRLPQSCLIIESN